MIARLVATLVLLAAPVAAQRLDVRVAAAPAGTVHFAFAARPEVCSCGRAAGCAGAACAGCATNVEIVYDCPPGPVRVSLTVRDGAVEALRTYVGGRWATPLAGAVVTELGAVATRDAVDFLLALAARDAGRAGAEAIFPAVLADSVTVWPALLKLARDERLSARTRRQAMFWLGQAAGEAATRSLTALVDDTSANGEVQSAAVFALAQRPRDEAVPALIRIAQTHPEPAVRRGALFWLGQSNDPRALALFEQLLAAP